MSVRFNAATDELARTASVPNFNNFTSCGWFRMLNAPGAFSVFVSMDVPSVTTRSLGTSFSGSNFRIYDGLDSVDGSAISLNTWYHLAMTADGTNVLAYVNGVLDITNPNSDTGSPSGETLVYGQNSFDSDNLDGNVQHARAWDAVLTENEIKLEMYSTLPVRLANLNFAWRDISASSVTDLGVNARNATIGGTLTLEDDPPVDDLLHPLWGWFTAAAAAARFGPGLVQKALLVR